MNRRANQMGGGTGWLLLAATLFAGEAFWAGARGQPAGAESQPPGWTSTWTQPLTPQERARSSFEAQLAAVSKSGNFQPLLAEGEQMAHDHPDDTLGNGMLSWCT